MIRHFRRLLPLAAAVVLATPADSQPSVSSARVSGAVYDSVGRRPLAGALIQLVVLEAAHISRSTRSDSSGRFQFDSVAAGTWLLGFYHAALDSLGLNSPLLQVVIRDTRPVRAMLAVPAPRTIVRATCGAGSDSSGLWVGRTREAENGHALPRASVVAQWTTLVASGNQVVRQAPTITTETSDDGTFGICGLPLGDLILARAWRSTDSSGVVSLAVPVDGLLSRDLFVPAVSLAGPLPAATDSTPPVRRGPGQIRGIVRKAGGEPLANVRLTFWETGDEVTTGSSGHYQLDSLPLGSATLEARALGYLPRTRTVDVLPTGPEVADFVMESRQAYLDTVRVVGTRIYESPQYRGFLDRKKRGFGHFLDEDAIERRNPIYVTDLFRMIPGVRIAPGAFGGQVLMRGTGFDPWCVPTVFIDGMRMANMAGFGFESFVGALDVRALEVYTRGSSIPAEFSNLDGCGAVVIWTGGRRQKLPQ